MSQSHTIYILSETLRTVYSTPQLTQHVPKSKVIFEYQKGETKRLFLSFNPDECQKGNYNLQVYHNGYMIGQVNKVLN